MNRPVQGSLYIEKISLFACYHGNSQQRGVVIWAEQLNNEAGQKGKCQGKLQKMGVQKKVFKRVREYCYPVGDDRFIKTIDERYGVQIKPDQLH